MSLTTIYFPTKYRRMRRCSMSEDFRNKSKYPISLNGIEIPSYRNNEERCVIKDVPFKENDFLGKRTFPTHVCYYYKCDSTPLEQKQRIIAEHKQRITCLLENVIKEEFDKFSEREFGMVFCYPKDYRIEHLTSSIILKHIPTELYQSENNTLNRYSINIDSVATVTLGYGIKEPEIEYILPDRDILLDDNKIIQKHKTSGISFEKIT